MKPDLPRITYAAFLASRHPLLDPLILAASDRDELLRRWDAMLEASPVR